MFVAPVRISFEILMQTLKKKLVSQIDLSVSSLEVTRAGMTKRDGAADIEDEDENDEDEELQA